MSPGQLFVLTVALLMLLMFAVGGVEFSIPFFQRLKFDNVCNKYLSVVQTQGGLNDHDRAQLRQDLEAIGFENVQIEAPENLSWNSEALLRIEADYSFEVVTGNWDMGKETITKKAVYENRTRVMTLER